jgi:MFS family permease
VSLLGRQLTVVAVPIQVFRMTHSSLAVGMTGLASLVPVLACSLVGGAMADAFDRRRLLLVANLLLAATSVGLALNAHRGRHASLSLVFVLVALNAGLSAIELPTRGALTPVLIRRELLPSAAALQQIVIQTGQVLGPALGGLLIAQVSLASAYWVDVATFAAAIAAVLALRPLPPEGGGTRASVASITEGIRFLKRRRVLQSTFYVDLDAMIFGMPRALFPQIAADVFHGGAATVGLLFAAPGAGAFIGAITSGWVGRVRRQGRAVVYAVAAWGAAIAVFGLTRWLPLALLMLALAGAADVISAVFRNTILQVLVPDALRGRLNAIHIGVVTGGPRLGDAEAGAVAALTSVRISAVSGGVACLVGVAVLAALIPELSAYDASSPTVEAVADG